MVLAGIVGAIGPQRDLPSQDFTNATCIFDLVNVNGWANAVVQFTAADGTTKVDFWDAVEGDGTHQLYEFTDQLFPRSIVTWLSATTTTQARCSIWYDQSGNGRNAIQDDYALMPAYDHTSRLFSFTRSSLVCLRLPSGCFPVGNSPFSIYAKTINTGNSTRMPFGCLPGVTYATGNRFHFTQYFTQLSVCLGSSILYYAIAGTGYVSRIRRLDFLFTWNNAGSMTLYVNKVFINTLTFPTNAYNGANTEHSIGNVNSYVGSTSTITAWTLEKLYIYNTAIDT